MLNFAIVAGSSRLDSQSGKVARFLRTRMIQAGLCSEHSSTVIDLGVTPLPLWPAEDSSNWAAIAAQLQAADGLIVIAPEWNGMAGPAIKNFFIYATKAELAHKPGLLVGVSSGIGGAYPISELRASSYKNCRICYLPEHLIVRQVEQVLNAQDATDDHEQRLHARIDYSLDLLFKYAVALKPVRAAVDMNSPAFANGM
ncbi:MAG: NAD(P)H-dependent oxidoreductase [Pseudomonas sp.]|uniref:NADPH-dependent FMN reductase n=1 Tax=Pseudomonas sp. TaxID=306 RepID=UPI0033931F21